MELLEIGLVMQSKSSILRRLGVILEFNIYCTLLGARDCAACYSFPNNSEKVTIIILIL